MATLTKVRHVAQHEAILNALKRAVTSEPLNVGRMRLQLLKWLTTHIPLDDKPLADFVKANRYVVDDCLVKCGS